MKKTKAKATARVRAKTRPKTKVAAKVAAKRVAKAVTRAIKKVARRAAPKRTAPKQIAYVATRKGLLAFQRRGLGWSAAAPAFLGEPVSAVLPDPRTGRLYAALRLGHFGTKLHHSDDGGTTWTELAAPAFPKQEEKDGEKKGPADDMVWTLVPGGADEPEVLRAGTTPGGLFRSADGGKSWQLIESLWNDPARAKWFGGGYDHPGIHSVLVDPRDSKRIRLGVSIGGVWASSDGGATWRQSGNGMRNAYMPPDKAGEPATQDVHRMASPAVNPDIVWLQHHNGIFRSTDGGANFTEITKVAPSVFGFVAAAHPLDPKTAWFVPGVQDVQRIPVGGRLVVTRTQDGGSTFEAIGKDLPRQDCYDLIYRHGLAVDGAGEHLVMGSTTGNLWIGDKGGLRWSLVSGHLPPIAAVAWSG